jgi:hypothetical protein
MKFGETVQLTLRSASIGNVRDAWLATCDKTGETATLHCRKRSHRHSSGQRVHAWVADEDGDEGPLLFDSDFGRRPFTEAAANRYREAARLVDLFCDGHEVGIDTLLSALSEVKGLFNRVSRRDQPDWYIVSRLLQAPRSDLSAALGAQIALARRSAAEGQSEEARLALEGDIRERLGIFVEILSSDSARQFIKSLQGSWSEKAVSERELWTWSPIDDEMAIRSVLHISKGNVSQHSLSSLISGLRPVLVGDYSRTEIISKLRAVSALLLERGMSAPPFLSPIGSNDDQLCKVMDAILPRFLKINNDSDSKIISSDAKNEETPFIAALDSRRREQRSVAVRPGQARFRAELTIAYDGKCAFTSSNAIAALQADHIIPYNGRDSDVISNGLLARADIHALFDRGELFVDPDTFKIELSDTLKETTYFDLDGKIINIPSEPSLQPSRHALELHRNWARGRRV